MDFIVEIFADKRQSTIFFLFERIVEMERYRETLSSNCDGGGSLYMSRLQSNRMNRISGQ